MSSVPVIGVWDLEQYEMSDKDGVLKPLIGVIRGRLFYTIDGYMSVVIVRENQNAKEGINPCYSGTYFLKGDQLEHTIHVSTVPRYVNSVESRKFCVEGSTLTLLYEKDPNGRIHRLTWRRLSSLKNS